MKRLALAVVGGFVIPFVYSIIVGPLTPDIKNGSLDYFAMVPVRWPVLILFYFGSFPFENEGILLLYLVGCNMALYTIFTYSLLWAFSRRRREGFGPPPYPPSFDQQRK